MQVRGWSRVIVHVHINEAFWLAPVVCLKVLGENVWGVTKGRRRGRGLLSDDLAGRGGDGSGVAQAGGRCLNGISDAVGRTFERVENPGQQARVVVTLGGLLGVFIDYLCRDTLERARPGLRGFAFEAWLGLSVDERGDGGELGVISVVDGGDPMAFLELVDGERGTGRGGQSDAFRAGWLG